jgi:hypothetical protein
MEGCTAIGREREAQRLREGIVFLLLFALTIPAANWLIGHAGTYCVPDGPFLPGQIVGKAWMVVLSIPFVAWLRLRDHRLSLAPA